MTALTPILAYGDATVADGPELDAAARESWVATFGQASPPADVALYLAETYGPGGRLRAELADPAHRFRLARDGERIVGFAQLAPCKLPPDTAPEGAAQLSRLYVLPPWHGTGAAAALMDWAIEAARAGGAPALVLTVWEENARALAFYRRRGFGEAGEYRFMVGTQADRDLVMRLDL